jgi:hypothetical protein
MITALSQLPSQAYAYVKNQPWLRNTLIVVLLLLLGYGAGRYLQPAKVVIQDHTVTVEHQTVVTQIKTEIKYVKVKDTSAVKQTHETETITKKPDGTTVEVVAIDTNQQNTTHTDTNVDKNKQANSNSTTDSKTDATHTQITTNEKEGWHMGIDLGLQLSNIIGNDPLVGIPGLHGAVVGVHAEHRVIGPLFLGLFGNSMGAAGLSVSAEF